MKITFSSLKNSCIFEGDFMHLSEQNGTIEFKSMLDGNKLPLYLFSNWNYGTRSLST